MVVFSTFLDLDEADSNLKNALDSKEVKDTEGEEDDDWLDGNQSDCSIFFEFFFLRKLCFA